MNASALVGGSHHRSFYRQIGSRLKRAAIEALEGRRYLAENPFELWFSPDHSPAYEGEWLEFELDFANSPYGVPEWINVAWGSFQQGFQKDVDFFPNGTTALLGTELWDDASNGTRLEITVDNGAEGDVWYFDS